MPELPQNGEVKTLGVCGKVHVATLVQFSAVRIKIAVCYHIYGYSEMQLSTYNCQDLLLTRRM